MLVFLQTLSHYFLDRRYKKTVVFYILINLEKQNNEDIVFSKEKTVEKSTVYMILVSSFVYLLRDATTVCMLSVFH